jgi:hypothetical protein
VSTWQPPTRAPQSARDERRSRILRYCVLGLCTAVVVAGYVGTLVSVSTDDIDGLNYFPNVLLAMPWNLLAAPTTWMLQIERNVYVEATIDFLGAMLNVALLGLLLRSKSRPRMI